ncbi:11060_t:CDS:10 [Funneliformis mosseae]|uniref:11060_t:CDS:1 n=1 Tax=Funneliformis mosseae TaxID=27381 RepID=A0A9N9EXE8_FUNMO|nr:11060_t:CDS:10 [Funneliformis mosseae]
MSEKIHMIYRHLAETTDSPYFTQRINLNAKGSDNTEGIKLNADGSNNTEGVNLNAEGDDRNDYNSNYTVNFNLDAPNPVILLVGKTDSGKSSLSNMLLGYPHNNRGPFHVSSRMKFVTRECGTAVVSIDGVRYNIVDTPGIFDIHQLTDDVLQEITNAVKRCAYGKQSGLQLSKRMFGWTKTFFGEEAIRHIIADIDNRWAISPNPDYISPDDPNYKLRLRKIKSLISAEEEKKAKEEYELKLKESAKQQSEEVHQRKLEEIKQEGLQQQYLDRERDMAQRYQDMLAIAYSSQMVELQVGDNVCSNVKNGKLEFSEVYLISHLRHHEFPLKMIKIEFTNLDGQKDLSVLYAQDVIPGEKKILVLNEMNELIPVIVDDLIIEKDTGYISFYTHAGTVIANNTLCSCYDDYPLSQALMDLAFAAIRW